MPDGSPHISRRTFLVGSLSVSGTVAATGLAGPIVRFAYPVSLRPVTARLGIASTAELQPLAGVVDFEYNDVPCSLVQLEDGSYSGLSRICTHLGCVVTWRQEQRDFFCPCHAGIFSPQGEVLAGPPPRPLPRLALLVEDDRIWATGWSEA
jgi:cytochrome b6-f complex iron-sulfur subunit